MFQPQYAIGIGEHNHFFTLRESHKVYVPAPGPMGNAVINGVYQGTVRVGWRHVKNLSQNPQEAIEKAHEAAKAAGIPLVTVTAAELGEQLDAIQRADAAEIARREQEARDDAAAMAERQKAMMLAGAIDVANGYLPEGMANAGKRIAEISFGYAAWLLDKREELEGLPRAVAEYVATNLRALHPWPVEEEVAALGAPGQRLQRLLVQVQRTIPIDSAWGRNWLMIGVDEDGHRVKQFCSGAKWAEPGDVCLIAATVKGEDDYRGERATMLQRVKVIERIPFAAPEDVPPVFDADGVASVAEAIAPVIFGSLEELRQAVAILTYPDARLARKIDALAHLIDNGGRCKTLVVNARKLKAALDAEHAAWMAEHYGD